MMVCAIASTLISTKHRSIAAVTPTGTINIVHGSVDIDMDFAGFAVEEIQFSLQTVLNVDMAADAYVDGVRVEGNFLVAPTVRLEFVRAWGRKGNGRQEIELGPETMTMLARLAVAAEEIANGLKTSRNSEPALTEEIGWTATNGIPRSQPCQASPYLTAEEAAKYLGISIKSLYGVVERRHLIPLRGPRRAYRFKVEMLDQYLKRR